MNKSTMELFARGIVGFRNSIITEKRDGHRIIRSKNRVIGAWSADQVVIFTYWRGHDSTVNRHINELKSSLQGAGVPYTETDESFDQWK